MIQNGGFPRFVKGVKGSLIYPYTRARNAVNGNTVHTLHKYPPWLPENGSIGDTDQ